MSNYTVDPQKLFQEIAKLNDLQRSTFLLESTIAMMNGTLKCEWATKIYAKRTDDRRASGGYTEEFNQFWKAYPKKVGKGAAMQLFKKQGQPLEACLKALEWQVQTKSWKEGYIPNPETYLRQRRYDDEPEIREIKKGYTDLNGIYHAG